MKVIRIVFMAAALLLALGKLGGQVPDWQWASSAGGDEWDEGGCIASDGQGNLYVAGFFSATAAFGSTVLTSTGEHDLFIAKLDASGNWLWARRCGGSELTGIAVDNAGNAYLTGCFWNSADFGPYTLIAAGYGLYDDIFVARLDPDGNWLWAVRAGGMNTDRGMGIALDSSGKVYVTGFYGYDAAIGGTNLNCAGAWDIFVAKLDPDGNWLWAVGAGGLGSEWGEDIVLDAEGNIYLTGSFQMTVAFGSHSLSCAGERDVLIAKLDQAGNWLWARRAGGWHYDHGTAIGLDGGGSLYCAGYFRENGDYGTDLLISAGSYDLFVCKLSTEGDWLWARREGGVESDQALDLDLDANSNAYLAGRFQSSVDIGQTMLISNGDYDALIASIDPAGDWLMAVGAGGPYSDASYGIVVTGSGIQATGSFTQSIDFGSHPLLSAGDSDIWAAKLNPMVGISDEVAIPAPAWESLTARPNPFSSNTILKADSVTSDLGKYASLVICDLRGRKVKTLACTAATLRDRGLAWDGRDEKCDPCPNGIYLARLVAGGKTQARIKVSLIK